MMEHPLNSTILHPEWLLWEGLLLKLVLTHSYYVLGLEGVIKWELTQVMVDHMKSC